MALQEEMRTRLEERLARLLVRTGRIESDLRKPGDRDWQERATELENEEVLEHLGEAEREEIRQIRDALARLDAGTYGTCQRCGEPIQERRLRALPYTAICVECADTPAAS